MDIVLIGMAAEEMPPPSTDLLDDSGLYKDFGEYGCSMYADAYWSGADDWTEVAEFQQDYGTMWNYTEGFIDGQGVDTTWQSFTQSYNNVTFDVDFTVGVNESNGNETWTTRYTYKGIDQGSVITVVTEDGADIYSYNPRTNTTTLEVHYGPGAFKVGGG